MQLQWGVRDDDDTYFTLGTPVRYGRRLAPSRYPSTIRKEAVLFSILTWQAGVRRGEGRPAVFHSSVTNSLLMYELYDAYGEQHGIAVCRPASLASCSRAYHTLPTMRHHTTRSDNEFFFFLRRHYVFWEPGHTYSSYTTSIPTARGKKSCFKFSKHSPPRPATLHRPVRGQGMSAPSQQTNKSNNVNVEMLN